MNEKLRNLGALVGKSVFTNQPLEFVVPKNTEVVFVSDMFAKEYQGGAELTTDAILRKSPYKTFQLHSSSLTIDMLEKYREKYWVFGNFVSCDAHVLEYLTTSGIKYSVIEYDYKYCMYRSEVLHQKTTGQPCDCVFRPHGILIEKFYGAAQHVFWMSEKQKEHFLSRIPALIFGAEDQHVVLSSVFSDETLDLLVGLRETRKETVANSLFKVWGIQGSSNWIKGTQDTINWCTQKKMPMKVLSNLNPTEFLTELSKCNGLVFKPLDFDTCPRVVIEAKVMGLDLELNDNVQHKDEPWFQASPEELLTYLKTRGSCFWSHIKL